jgi:hypothetical protein
MEARLAEAPRRMLRPPHRSRRTLLSSARAPWLRGILSLVIGVGLTYLFLREAWPILMGSATSLTDESGRMGPPILDSLIGISNVLPNPVLPSLNLLNMLWVAGGLLFAQVIVALLPWRNTPLRYWVSANLLVPMLAALYAFFTTHLGYDGAQYMSLVERTSLLMILCAPAFVALVAALLPFTIVEIAAMLLFMVLSDALFAVVRIVAFALLVSRFGAIVEMNLYMFFGPLMDAAYFITVYSLVVVSLSRRLNRSEGVWQWS